MKFSFNVAVTITLEDQTISQLDMASMSQKYFLFCYSVLAHSS